MRLWQRKGRRQAWPARMGIIGVGVLVCAACAACAPAQPTVRGGPTPTGPWATYQDRLYPFQAPIPPAWQANAYTSEAVPGDQCAHEVDLVPPASQASWTPAPPVPAVPELIRIVVPVKCADWSPADNAQLASRAQAITIGGAPATLYDGLPDGATIVRMAVARFGGHQYQFAFAYSDTVATPASKAQAELALYMRVLRGFVYSDR